MPEKAHAKLTSRRRAHRRSCTRQLPVPPLSEQRARLEQARRRRVCRSPNASVTRRRPQRTQIIQICDLHRLHRRGRRLEITNGGSARVLSESICHSARCHIAGETCYQNLEPVLGDQHGGSKLGLVLLVVGSQVGSHQRSAWGRIEPAAPFDSGRSPGIQRRSATSAGTRDLVRIEVRRPGVAGAQWR